MHLSVLLDRSRPDSLTTQMVDQIREAIRSARIGPGTRLPSSRRLSEQLAISRNTVVRAYDLLLMGRHRRVASRLRNLRRGNSCPAITRPFIPSSNLVDPALRSLMPMPLRHARMQNAPQAAHHRMLYDFSPGRPSPGSVSAKDLAAPATEQSVARRRRGSHPVWRACGTRGVAHSHRKPFVDRARHRRRPKAVS